jgi:hypothetical protein
MRRLLLCALLLSAAPAAADIYSYEDKQGIIHFTNVPPSGGTKSKWKVLYKTGPGKALTVSGSSIAGCKVSRADVVGAKDRSPDRYVRYDAIIAEFSQLYAIPEPLIRAVIKVESDYDPQVVSCAGAKGLMQIMPYEETSQHIDHVFDPRQNIGAGTRLLRELANHFKGDLVRTIAGYHAGIGAVTKYGGVPPYQTTQDYVRMVTKQYERYQARALATTVPPG